MDEKNAGLTTCLTLPNQPAIEPNLIGGADTNSQDGQLAVNGDASGTNPVLDLTARR